MTRLWSSGGELNSLTANVEITSLANTPVMESSVIRSGFFSHETSGTGIDAVVYQPVSADTDTGTFFIRVYMRIASLPDADTAILRVLDSGANLSGDIRLTTGGNLQLFQRGSTQVGSNSSALSTNTWYRIELEITPSNAGTGSLRGRLNGIEFAGSASANTDSMHTIRWGKANSATAELYFDDIAINDSTGSFQNSWPGEGKIIHLRPNANGNTVDWSDDVTGDSYTAVNEVTPDDDSTNLLDSGTATHEVELDSSGPIGGSDTINCVQVGFRFNVSSTAGTQPVVVLRIKASSGGTVEESSNITFNTTTWNTNATAAPRNYPLTLYDLPGASTTAWAKSNLDTTQIGVRNTINPTGNAQVSTLWLLVDYTPPTPAGVTLCQFRPGNVEFPTSNPAGLTTRNGHPVLAFNDTTQETVYFTGVMPRSYSGGDIAIYLHSSAASATSGASVWDIAFERIGDGSQDIDSDGFASAQQIGPNPTSATSGNVLIQSVVMTNAQCDSIAAGEAFRIQVRRDPSVDNISGDMELHAIELREVS